MSAPLTPLPPCGVCGQESCGEHGGVHLCDEHWAVARRLAKLTAAQTDPAVDLTGLRSRATRDSHDAGRQRPFDVVPDDSLERVNRDVTATFSEVPFWAVEYLFHRVHVEMGRDDLDGWQAKLVIDYSNLSESEFARLLGIRDLLWLDFDVEVTKTRLYPPHNRQLASSYRRITKRFSRAPG